MRRFLLCLALWLVCLTIAEAQVVPSQAVRDSLRWEQVLGAYQSFCELAADARSGDAEARAKLRKQADNISTLLAQVKGSRMTASQQARFEKMKKRYAAVVTLPDLTATPMQVPAPVQVIQGQTVVIRDTVFVVREIRQTDTVRVVEQVEKIVEVPVERVVEVPVAEPVEQVALVPLSAPRPRTDYLFLAQAAVPDFSFGAMLGAVRKAGLYVRFDSNFHRQTADYSCTRNGQAPYGQVWTTGRSVMSRFSVTGGALWHPLPWLSAYAGVGYGERGLYWEDYSGKWAQVSDASASGITADLGLVFNLDHFALSAGITAVAFRRFDAILGLGLFF